MLPALNEVEGMRAVVPRIDRGLFARILYVDGGSTDGSVEYAREQGLEVIVQSGRGLPNALDEAFALVTTELVVTFSPDGNCIPELLPALCRMLEAGDHDLIVVSRYLQGARSLDDDIMTGFGNWLFTRLANLLFGARCTDLLGMFRGYRSEAIRTMNLHRLPLENQFRRDYWRLNSWELAGSLRAARLRLRYAEIPGDEPARVGGDRKMSVIRNGFATVGSILLDFLLFWPTTRRNG
ncbi:MAG: glycosyltransferase family 2 protein [Magnetococcales bacterium]|nr:glycosyltransferase family 2 protein [Magnetococcales bacterium]